MSVQLTPVERKQRKRFTAQQKLAILREWETSGNGVEVAERHGIHPMTLYRWRKRLETGAAEFLKGTRPRVDPRMRFTPPGTRRGLWSNTGKESDWHNWRGYRKESQKQINNQHLFSLDLPETVHIPSGV